MWLQCSQYVSCGSVGYVWEYHGLGYFGLVWCGLRYSGLVWFGLCPSPGPGLHKSVLQHSSFDLDAAAKINSYNEEVI